MPKNKVYQQPLVERTRYDPYDVHQGERTVTDLRSKLTVVDDAMLGIALLSIALMAVEVQLVVSNENQGTLGTTLLKALMTVLSLSLEGLLFSAYSLRAEMKRKSNDLLCDASLSEMGFVPYITAEALLLLIHVPPGLDFMFYLPLLGQTAPAHVDVFGMVMLSRLYLLTRWVQNHSIVRTSSTKFIGGLSKISTDTSFMLKTVIYQRPGWFCMMVFVVFIPSAAFVMNICERGVSAELTYADSIWLTVITMTTVGYGDTFPVTICGRAISVVAVSVGLFMTSLAVVLIQDKLDLSFRERRIIAVLYKDRLKRQLRQEAARVIQDWFRLWSGRLTSKAVLYARIRNLQRLRKEILLEEDADPVIGQEDLAETVARAVAQRSAPASGGTQLQGIEDRLSAVEDTLARMEALLLELATKNSS